MISKELFDAYGWTNLGQQKNVYMTSYVKDDMRMNIYSTGTITIQHEDMRKMKVYRNITNDEEFEKILL